MNQKLLAEIGRTQRLDILNALKRTQGMSINQLVGKLKRSYMGIKQHCVTLENDGYLDTWRRPQKMGRPEMVYRLTRRAHDLFPAESNEFTIELLKSIEQIYGPTTPDKLLFNIFDRKTAALKARITGNTVAERAKWLARLRDSEGYMSQFEGGEEEDASGPQILECHSPLLNLLEPYPIIARLEQEMFETLLQTRVRREEAWSSGLFECRFLFDVNEVRAVA